MNGDKRVLAAGTAVALVLGMAGAGIAQPAGPSSTSPQGGERIGVALPTDAADLFARDRNISVSQRPREGYEARGLRAGTLLLYPKVTATAEYNDNIYATEGLEEDDVIWRVTPEVSLSSDWNRHAIGAYARTTLSRYSDAKDENTTDYSVGANGRMDVLRFTNLRGNIDYSKLTEPRTSPDSPGLAAEPVRYKLGVFGLVGQHTVNRLRFTARYDARRYDYQSVDRVGGGRVDQSYRDRVIQTYGGRIDYAVSPASAVFVEVTGNDRNYDYNGSATDLGRDSDGYQVLAGTNFELSALLRGELAVGYLEQKFDDARLDKIDGFGVRAELEWFPTQLTTVTFSGSRSVEDSATPGSGGYLANNVGVVVDHELLRNVILTARASYGEDEYDVVGRRDERQAAGLSATYLLNRGLGVTGGWSFDRRDVVKGVGVGYKQHKVFATLTAQF